MAGALAGTGAAATTGAGAGAGVATGAGVGAATEAGLGAATGAGAGGGGAGTATTGLGAGAAAVGVGAGAGVAGTAGVLAGAVEAAPDSFFSSSTFLESSATRDCAAVFSRSLESFSSGAEAFTPPLLSVSLSGVGAAATLRSSTLVWTLPPA